MTRLSLILLLILSSACKPTIENGEICAISTKINFNENKDEVYDIMERYQYALLTDNVPAQRIIQEELFSSIGYCRCKMFDFNTGESVENTSVSYPLEKCSDIIGPHRDFFLTKLQPYLRELYRYLNRKNETKVPKK